MKEFSKEEIEQFKKNLYDELIKMGEKEILAREESDCSDKCISDLLKYGTTPRKYAEMYMM